MSAPETDAARAPRPPLAELRATYDRLLDQRSAAVARLARRDDRVVRGRLLLVISLIALWLLAVRPGHLSGLWLIVPAVGFLFLVAIHGSVLAELARGRRRVQFYQRGLARLDGDWVGKGRRGDHLADANHPYAPDLDLFGEGSLFELLSSARTPVGEATLGRWLLGPASVEEIRARQRAVLELAPAVTLREDLYVDGGDFAEHVDPAGLIGWAHRPGRRAPLVARIALLGLAAVNLAVLAAWFAGRVNGWPLLGSLLAVVTTQRLLRSYLEAAQVGAPVTELQVLASVLGHIEKQDFQSPRLLGLKAKLGQTGATASTTIRQLAELVTWDDARRNQLFGPIAYLLLWGPQFAFAIESWRLRHGPALEGWLQTVGEFEALLSLAGYASEHPDDPFPEVIEGPARFEALAIGHPLIPLDRCVRNDVSLGPERQLLLVSGSNMSGKSTLLRTVGTNVVLAMAGAPVRAERLRLSRLAIGATLRIQDSLAAGASRFYAEITRLAQVLELAAAPAPAPPLLFLLDEILHGTNSADRQKGAAGIVAELLRRGAIGLVTTHDLALAGIVAELPGRAENVHFEDHMEGAQMVFDYRMRPGVVTRSNALALMRAVGIKV